LSLRYTPGPISTFATHGQLAGYGFAYGPSDGEFGAVPDGGGVYTFYGDAASNATCAGTRDAEGTFSFAGTLRIVTGSSCRRLFGPGDGPAGWIFDRDYAGGGEVVPFAVGPRRMLLMPFHGEVHWQNPATANHKCDNVLCFYSSLGLAVSTDNGRTFKIAGEIMQPSQPLSAFVGGGKYMAVGYGSLVVADAEGSHLATPPPDPARAYLYLFYSDLSPGLPGACATQLCMGVARASYLDVAAAIDSADPHALARLFHKYDGATPNAWTQPATSDTQNDSGTAGTYAPLWTDEPGGSVEVVYDRGFDIYLAAYFTQGGIKVRSSRDLLHWSAPIGPTISEPGRTLYYPTIVGETGDPTVAGRAPRAYFSSFPTGAFPDYRTAVLETVELQLYAGS
jgi:hypothetical protein